MYKPTCRCCGSLLTESMGSLPDVHEFAGRVHTLPIAGGSLNRCRACSFVFRHPILTADQYVELYRHGSASIWNGDGSRRDFAAVRSYLESTAIGPNVLDVGCYTGNLLKTLPARYRPYGIEPNVSAASIATQRGITIVASDVDQLKPSDGVFDAIIACDVVEHVTNPLQFLRQLRDRLNVGGKLIITTGNSDAWMWKMTKSKFWYCYFPEHISFLGRQWFTDNSHVANLKVEALMAFNYRFEQLNLFSAKVLSAALLYAAFPNLYRHGVSKVKGGESIQFSPPGCGATKDHLLCVMSPT